MHFVTFEDLQIHVCGTGIPNCWNLEVLVYEDGKPSSLKQHCMT